MSQGAAFRIWARSAMPGVATLVHRWRYARHVRLKRAYLNEQKRNGTYCFIHINKCGGTSVEAALRLPTKIHDTAMERRAIVGPERWEAMATFALVRHPYARLCSHYRYIVATHRREISRHPVDLNGWIERVLGERDPRYLGDPRMVMPCFDWLCDEQGRIIVDFVGKLETIDRDWPRIQEMTGVTAALPLTNTTDQRMSGVAELTPASRHLIGEVFARDFDAFGYDR